MDKHRRGEIDDVNVNHLKAFYEVAKAKSFTLAARQMDVSQPTLSMQVKSLEKRVALPLIKRNKKAFELTSEGEVVFRHAEKILSLIQDMKKELENFEIHNMIIGSTPYLSDYVLPDILLAIRERHGDAKIQIYTGTSQEILDKVVDNEYHLAVIGKLPYPDNIVSIPVLKAKLMFISKENMGERVSLEQLANHPIILPEEGSATRDYLIREFAAKDLTITNLIDCENPQAIQHMVQLGSGGAFFPQFYIRRSVQEGLFHMAETEEDLSLDYNLIFLKDRRSSHFVRVFVSTMKRMRQIFPQ
ncbi:MAG: LysR family transcriptional regulator [Planctomycetota bacterium]|nr:LysR family transcriptional regulator [Planctomycetota bacterium]